MKSDQIEKRIKHLIQLLNIPDRERKISEISGGQQRLVSMSVTMIHRPLLLILDEPTVGIDSLLRCRIWQYLENICKNDGISESFETMTDIEIIFVFFLKALQL
jgi:ABC-2 type transport system ATP-binding protein